MRKIINYVVLTSFLVCGLTQGQEKKVKKAEDNFDNYAYEDAITSYEDLVKEGYTTEEIYKNLGNANYLNAKYEEAADWYAKLFQLDSAHIDAEYMYRYSQTLKSLENYSESDQWMQKFEAAKGSDVRAKKFVDNTDYLVKIGEQSGRYDIKNLALNSAASDFAPSFNGDMLVFSTARDSGITSRNIHKWNNKAFLNLYSATPSENGDFVGAFKLSKNLNKKTHESSTAFTKDGNTVYFTRNNSENGKFSRDEEGISRLKVYRATLQNGEWTNIVELPFNGDAHSVAHPTLSPDESKLYFASDMIGSFGQSDIFVVDIKSDGIFGVPKNLGNTINTEGRETFPYVTDSNVLYFASDGHPGLGGLDVFATKIEDLDHLYIVNVGKPVNSEEDDFSFIIDEQNKKGYFASNRDGGIGSDDIYRFDEKRPLDLTCNTLMEGIVKDQQSRAPLSASRVTLIDNENQVVANSMSGADGSFSLEGPCRGRQYKVIASKENYEDGEKMFSTIIGDATSGLEVLLKPKSAAVGTDLAKLLKLKPIYFDLNKAVIRSDAKDELNKVLEYMKTHTQVKIEVGSHTDSRGKDSYNLNLSNRRAKSSVEYLISQGIESRRISGKGYGETQLTNECSNGVPCSRTKQQANRRSEFIVIK